MFVCKLVKDTSACFCFLYTLVGMDIFVNMFPDPGIFDKIPYHYLQMITFV
jgi:hypothetical protein